MPSTLALQLCYLTKFTVQFAEYSLGVHSAFTPYSLGIHSAIPTTFRMQPTTPADAIRQFHYRGKDDNAPVESGNTQVNLCGKVQGLQINFFLNFKSEMSILLNKQVKEFHLIANDFLVWKPKYFNFIS